MPASQHRIISISPATADTLDVIAATAARYVDLLDELCRREPQATLDGPSSRRIALDQAAAAAADLHTLAAGLASGRS